MFLSVSWTRRGPVHTDVALWYLLDAESEQIVSYDDAEFTAVPGWLSFDARDRESSARVFDAAVGAARARPRTEYYLAVVPPTTNGWAGSSGWRWVG